MIIAGVTRAMVPHRQLAHLCGLFCLDPRHVSVSLLGNAKATSLWRPQSLFSQYSALSRNAPLLPARWFGEQHGGYLVASIRPSLIVAERCLADGAVCPPCFWTGHISEHTGRSWGHSKRRPCPPRRHPFRHRAIPRTSPRITTTLRQLRTNV